MTGTRVHDRRLCPVLLCTTTMHHVVLASIPQGERSTDTGLGSDASSHEYRLPEAGVSDGHQLPDAATEATASGCRGGRVCRTRRLDQDAFAHGTGLRSQTADGRVDSRESTAGGDPPHLS